MSVTSHDLQKYLSRSQNPETTGAQALDKWIKSSLAFKIQLPEEADFPAILAEPLRIIVEALQAQSTWDEMLCHLPDISLESAKSYSLV